MLTNVMQVYNLFPFVDVHRWWFIFALDNFPNEWVVIERSPCMSSELYFLRVSHIPHQYWLFRCFLHTSYFGTCRKSRVVSIESSKTKSVYICLGSLYHCVRFATIAFFTVGAVLTYSPPNVLVLACRIVCNGYFPTYSNIALLDFVLDCTLSNIVIRRLYDQSLCKTQ